DAEFSQESDEVIEVRIGDPVPWHDDAKLIACGIDAFPHDLAQQFSIVGGPAASQRSVGLARAYQSIPDDIGRYHAAFAPSFTVSAVAIRARHKSGGNSGIAENRFEHALRRALTFAINQLAGVFRQGRLA